MFIRTKQFTDLIGISEAELLSAYQQGEFYKSVRLPTMCYNGSGHSRRFKLAEVLKFREQLVKKGIIRN